jgi:hypothetical protein
MCSDCGSQPFEFEISPVVAADDRYFRDISIDPHENLIPELAIFGKTLNSTLTLGMGLRSKIGHPRSCENWRQ